MTETGNDCPSEGCYEPGYEEYCGFCPSCWVGLSDDERAVLKASWTPTHAEAAPLSEPIKINYRIFPALRIYRLYLAILAAVLTPDAARAVWHWLGRMM